MKYRTPRKTEKSNTGSPSTNSHSTGFATTAANSTHNVEGNGRGGVLSMRVRKYTGDSNGEDTNSNYPGQADATANSEGILQFYVSNTGSTVTPSASDEGSSSHGGIGNTNKMGGGSENDERLLTDKEAAAILGGLYGGNCEISTGEANEPEVKSEKDDTNNSSANGESSIHKTGRGGGFLKIQGMGQNEPLLILDRITADEYLERFTKYHRIASDAFLNSEFYNGYEKLFKEGVASVSSSTCLYIYTCLAIGTIVNPVSSLSLLSTDSQSLFAASSSLVGAAVLEGNISSVYGLGAFGHLCMLCGEFVSQSKFLRMALNLLISMGLHKNSKYQPQNTDKGESMESHARIFWHVYTVTYLHCVFFDTEVDIYPLEKITTPSPNVNHDTTIAIDATYLGVKIEFVQLHRWAVAELTDEVKQNLEAIDGILEKFHSNLGNQVSLASDFIYNLTQESEEAREMYQTVLRALSVHILVCTYRIVPNPSHKIMERAEIYSSEFVDLAWNYVFSDNFTRSSSWYICHYVFMTAILLIYCVRVKKKETSEYHQPFKKIEKCIEILNYVKNIIPFVSKWIEVLYSLLKSSGISISEDGGLVMGQNETPVMATATDTTAPSINGKQTLESVLWTGSGFGEFLDYFTESDSELTQDFNFLDWFVV